MRLRDVEHLETLLRGWNSDYQNYAKRMWQAQVRDTDQLANAGAAAFAFMGVDNPIHADDIKTKAGGQQQH